MAATVDTVALSPPGLQPHSVASARRPGLLPSSQFRWNPSPTSPSYRRRRQSIDHPSTEPLWGGCQRAVRSPSPLFPLSLCSSLSQKTSEPIKKSHRDAVYLADAPEVTVGGEMCGSYQSQGERKRPVGRCWLKLVCVQLPLVFQGC